VLATDQIKSHQLAVFERGLCLSLPDGPTQSDSVAKEEGLILLCRSSSPMWS